MYRADTVGSLLRPPFLLTARQQYRQGALTPAAFKQIEDRAVDEAIALQERAGLDVVTDGELRRAVFTSQMMEAVEGFGRVPENVATWHTAEGQAEERVVNVGVVAPLQRRRHLSAEEFTYLRAKAARPTKITIPSPTMLAYYWVPGVSEAAYASPQAYLEDVTTILRQEVAELVRLGATYIQIDAPEFGMLIDPQQRAWFASKGFDPDWLIHEGVAMINSMIDGYSDVTFGVHICRGNNASRWMAQGGYGPIAGPVFRGVHAQRLLLEYDDERSGDFAPLAEVPEDKVVVLGLLTTKRDTMETVEALRARIKAASHYVPLSRLALSPQCGFASVSIGNAISPATQQRKLELVATVARQVWND